MTKHRLLTPLAIAGLLLATLIPGTAMATPIDPDAPLRDVQCAYSYNDSGNTGAIVVLHINSVPESADYNASGDMCAYLKTDSAEWLPARNVAFDEITAEYVCEVILDTTSSINVWAARDMGVSHAGAMGGCAAFHKNGLVVNY
jgi:hypothetical protein